MSEPLSPLYAALTSMLLATTVSTAAAQDLPIDFGHIQPGLAFGTSCSALLRALDELGLTYVQQEKHDWVSITSGQILGHPLQQTSTTPSGGSQTSKLWCSPATGMYRVELNWAASPTHSVYTRIIETLSRKLRSPPNSKKIRRRGARACATWPATKTSVEHNTVQVCQARAFTQLSARSPTLEKAAKAANAIKRLNTSTAP